MGSFALVDVTTHIGGYDWTTDMNQMTFGLEAEGLDNTTFGNGGWRSRLAGLRDINAELAGYWQAGATSVDVEAFTKMGTANEVVTMGPTNVEGETAYLWRGEKLTYDLFGNIGEVTPFNVAMTGSHGEGAARGAWLKKKANVSSTGATGTAFQIPGGILADTALHASFHVFSVGTTITAVLESDDSSSFASATTRLTFGPITATGGTYGRVEGAIADTWYRLRVTAATGTFNIASAIGVGV
jgi:hypothetical protein